MEPDSEDEVSEEAFIASEEGFGDFEEDILSSDEIKESDSFIDVDNWGDSSEEPFIEESSY